MPVLDKPIKTYLMESINTALLTVTALKEVKYGHSLAVDHDVALDPSCNYYDEGETSIDHNRETIKNFDLVIEVWSNDLGSGLLYKSQDVLSANIEKAILENANIKYYSRNITFSDSGRRIYRQEDGNMGGVLQLIFKTLYIHAFKDPYNLSRP